MKWDLVEQELATAFQTVVAEAGGARVLMSESRVDLDSVLGRAEEPGDREQEDLGEFFSEDFDRVDPRGLLGCRWPVSVVLGFEWMGLFLDGASLDQFDLGGGRALVGLGIDELDYQTVALVEGGAAGWSLLFPGLCESNGERYGVDLFTSLPGTTENRRPDLLPMAVVREGYRRWLDIGFFDYDWRSLAENIMGRAELGPGFFDTPGALNNKFDQNQREFLLDLYFKHCYGEMPS
jgi:hypothetical protein